MLLSDHQVLKTLMLVVALGADGAGGAALDTYPTGPVNQEGTISDMAGIVSQRSR